jgi:predicted N-acetyltransferase YhbS
MASPHRFSLQRDARSRRKRAGVAVTETKSEIDYRTGNELDLDQVIELYRASTLGERRPVDVRDSMRRMLEHANLVVTAWDGPRLVGIARTLTDFAYVAYLSDLAVRASYQRQGIGKELIRRTQAELGSGASLVLLAAPAAVGYYPRIGFTAHASAWMLYPGDRLK